VNSLLPTLVFVARFAGSLRWTVTISTEKQCVVTSTFNLADATEMPGCNVFGQSDFRTSIYVEWFGLSLIMWMVGIQNP